MGVTKVDSPGSPVADLALNLLKVVFFSVPLEGIAVSEVTESAELFERLIEFWRGASLPIFEVGQSSRGELIDAGVLVKVEAKLDR